MSLLALLWAPNAVLGFDALSHVVWGRDLAAGHLPVYDPATAPTPHPLQLLLAALVAPLGPAAPDAFRLVHLAALGAVAAALVVLGRRLAGPAAGVLAAVLLVGQPFVLDLAHRGQADLPALALVLWAAVLEQRRRGLPVLGLLALAGLLRPEAWLLSLLYACRSGSARRWTATLAVAGPVLWALADLVVTGNPLWSFTQTHDLTERLSRRTGLSQAWPVAAGDVHFVLGLVPAVAGVGGLAVALWRLPRRAAPTVALLVLGALGFTVLAAARLSLQPRYLLLAMAALALLAALVALGWTSVPALSGRRWRALGLACLVALAAGQLARAGRLEAGRIALAADDRSVYGVLADPRFRAAYARCGQVAVGTAYLIPHVALALGLDQREVHLAPHAGVYLGPSPTGATSIGGGLPGVLRDSDNLPAPAAADVVLTTPNWVVLATC